ncbi:MAG: DUF2384 domain-containing protein, partial [Proteobacteria bacterium]|nr:DUF2384 domain-containing protein [Pseudomonadota bacterium]
MPNQQLRLDDLLNKAGFQENIPVSRAGLAAFASAVGADEREDAASQLELSPDQLRLMAGELSEQEILTVQAVLRGLAWRIRNDPYRRRVVSIEAINAEAEIVSAADARLALSKQLSQMMEGSAHPDVKTLNAEEWLADWIQRPQPALGGSAPFDLIKTRA